MKFFKAFAFFVILFCFLFVSKSVRAEIRSYQITSGINSPHSGPSGVRRVFYFKNIHIDYLYGKIILSSNSDGTGAMDIQDGVQVIGENNGLYFLRDTIQDCATTNYKKVEPIDITYLLKPGGNNLLIRFYDLCGRTKSVGPVYVTYITPPVLPFLDLPWDYKGNGLTFNEASTRMSAFFDHEYPLFMSEPSEVNRNVVNYKGLRTDNPYSSHNGYDYAKFAQANYGEPVLAAADGEATYFNSCAACGNMIKIDHMNGFQTIYMHMLKDRLITNIPGQKVNVAKGQQIGKIGSEGNSTGAHIHFGVVQDKDNDGDFNDNATDGLTDPYGWQSAEPDPWENYVFPNGLQQGNKSFYLWTTKLDDMNKILMPSGGTFSYNKCLIKFPSGVTHKDAFLNIKYAAIPRSSNLLGSVGSNYEINVIDNFGNKIKLFPHPFNLTLDFKNIDLSRFKPGTISIYSSDDGVNWNKENTSVDEVNSNANTQINHLSFFTLMAERLDAVAPTTSAEFSNNKLTLTSTDNDGGFGVEYISYSLDGALWEEYKDPIEVAEEGHHKIEFFAEDKDGNIEETKRFEFDVDKTPPEVKLSIDPNIPDLAVEGIDQSKTNVEKIDNTNYRVTDTAGNATLVSVKDFDHEKRDLFKLFSIQYNDTENKSFVENKYIVRYQKNIPVEQKFEIKNEVQLTIKYDFKQNKSTILQKDKKIEEIKDGLVLLKVQTDKGLLKYYY